MKKPELLAPAGSFEKAKVAFLYGADAVYLASTRFGLRTFAGNFDQEELKWAVEYAHKNGVKVYVPVGMESSAVKLITSYSYSHVLPK